MAEEGLNKTTLIILGVIVIVLVLFFILKPNILDWFRNLPGYWGENDTLINQKDNSILSYYGFCGYGKEVAKLSEGKWVTININNKEIKTRLYYKSSRKNGEGIIAIYEGTSKTDDILGEIKSDGRVLIYEDKINKKDNSGNLVYDSLSNEVLKIISGSFLRGNYFCREDFSFKCEDLIAGVSDTYKNRYQEYSGLFEKYANIYKPSDFDLESFKALLAAIAQKESSMGYPNGKDKDDSYFTGYGSSRSDAASKGWLGVENQLNMTASYLKKAFENNNEKYKACYNYQSDEKMKCILSIYRSGGDYKVNEIGKNYADEVISYYKNWKGYFCQGKIITQPANLGIFPLSFPVDTINISSCFGYRGKIRIDDASLNHPAIDIPVPFGTNVKAAADGIVVQVSNKNSDYVLLYHGNGFFTRYVHVDGNNLKEGQRVKRGEIIARVSNKGSASHLHFEVLFVNQNLINPGKIENINPNKNIRLAAENSTIEGRQKAIFVFALPNLMDVTTRDSSESIKDYLIISLNAVLELIKRFKQPTTLHLNPLCFFDKETINKINKTIEEIPTSKRSLSCNPSTGGSFKGCKEYKWITDISDFFTGSYEW